MAKIRVGNMVIKSNEKLTGKHYKLFTEYGHNKINEFLQSYSRDFRVVFDMLWEYQAQPTAFYGSDFLKVLDNSKSFKKFVFAASVQQMFQIKFPFAEFYVKLIKACYTNYQINIETGARGWVVGAFHSLIATYPEYRIFLSELIQSLDITENINSGRFIYLDEHIALTYNQDIKNEGLGERKVGGFLETGFPRLPPNLRELRGE